MDLYFVLGTVPVVSAGIHRDAVRLCMLWRGKCEAIVLHLPSSDEGKLQYDPITFRILRCQCLLQ
jgi:hypothetical protein